MKTSIVLLLAVLFMSQTSIHTSSSDPSRSLKPKEFKLKQQNLHGVLIDVRTAREFLTETIPGAICLDVMANDFKDKIAKLDKAKTYFLFCGTGMRSACALDIMKKAGFLKLYELDGGLTAWQSYDFPLD
jgi:rhodanese-related sulfurtransferase